MNNKGLTFLDNSSESFETKSDAKSVDQERIGSSKLPKEIELENRDEVVLKDGLKYTGQWIKNTNIR